MTYYTILRSNEDGDDGLMIAQDSPVNYWINAGDDPGAPQWDYAMPSGSAEYSVVSAATPLTRDYKMTITVKGGGSMTFDQARSELFQLFNRIRTNRGGQLITKHPNSDMPLTFDVVSVQMDGPTNSRQANTIGSHVVPITLVLKPFAKLPSSSVEINLAERNTYTDGIANPVGSDWQVRKNTSGTTWVDVDQSLLHDSGATYPGAKTSTTAENHVWIYTGSDDLANEISIALDTKDFTSTNEHAIILKWIDDNNYLEVALQLNGATYQIQLASIWNGVRTIIMSNAKTFRAATAFRVRMQGATVLMEHYDTYQANIEIPSNTNMIYTIPAGVVRDRYRFLPARFGFRIKTSVSGVNGRAIWCRFDNGLQRGDMRGNQFSAHVGGTAPALVNIDQYVSQGSGIFPLVSNHIAWWKTLPKHNLVHNGGSRQLSPDGWRGTDPAAGHAASTVTNSASYNSALGSSYSDSAIKCVTTGANANEGCSYRMFRRLRPGDRVCASYWVYVPSGTPSLAGFLNVWGAQQTAVVFTQTAASWQQHFLEWDVPEENSTTVNTASDLTFGLMTNGTIATTFALSDVRVWVERSNDRDGSGNPVPPALVGVTQISGGLRTCSGGLPPVGWIDTRSFMAANSVGHPAAAAANTDLAAGSTLMKLAFPILPWLYIADRGKTHVSFTVYAQTSGSSAASPTINAYMAREQDTAVTMPVTPLEYAAGARAVSQTGGAGTIRNTRIGTFIIPVDQVDEPWLLFLELARASVAGTLGVRELWIMPTDQFLYTPDGMSSAYQAPFMRYTYGKRTTRWDRSGFLGVRPSTVARPYRGTAVGGLGGSSIILDPGEWTFMQVINGMVMEPNSAGTIGGASSPFVISHPLITRRTWGVPDE